MGTNGTVKGIRFDDAGNQVWTSSPVAVSSVQSSKGKLDAGEFLSGQMVVAWGDDRTGNSDIFAQNLSEDGMLGPLIFELSATPDTLFFLTPESFVTGVPFTLTNTGSTPVDILFIQPYGSPAGNFTMWYIDPPIATYPVTLNPGENLTETVFWLVMDGYPGTTVFDTLEISSTADSVHLIIAVDSTHIWMGGKKLEPPHLQIFPNPFSEETRLSFTLTSQAFVQVTIFNAQMKKIETLFDMTVPPGPMQVIWDGTNDAGISQPQGIYFVILKTNDTRVVQKVMKVH